MTTILIAQENFDPECVTVFDASTPEKRAKAFTYGIMSSYGQYVKSDRDKFPDTENVRELLGYLDQIIAAGEEAWKLPHPEDHPYTRKHANNPTSQYSCLAEWASNWIAHDLWIDVRDMWFAGYAWSYTLSEMRTVSGWTAADLDD